MGMNSWTVGNTDGLTEYEAELYKEWVQVTTHNTYNNKTTVLVLQLKNSFEVVGTAGCEDPIKFTEELGHLHALKDALRKLNELVAFNRAQVSYVFSSPTTKADPFSISQQDKMQSVVDEAIRRNNVVQDSKL